MLRIAKAGEGEVIIPIISDIVQNILFQKLVKCLDQKTCMSCLIIQLPLQHDGDCVALNLEILYGVRYYLKAIFWESSQWLVHLEA